MIRLIHHSPLHCWMIKQKIHFPFLASLILCRRRRLPCSSALSVERSDEVFTPAIETLLITYCLLTLPSRESSIFTRAGEFIYRYQECLDIASKSNNLTDRFLFFLHFDPVLLNFLSSFIYISRNICVQIIEIRYNLNPNGDNIKNAA